MKIAIFIRSYYKDAPWLDWCLKSIKKYATGFEYVLVATPRNDHKFFAPLKDKYGFRAYEYVLHIGKGMLHGNIMLCRADELCPDVDFVLSTDSDCVFTQPVNPSDYFVNNKPVLFAKKFFRLEQEKSRAVCWRQPIANALGFDPPYETIRRHPTVHYRDIFKPFRDAVEKHVKTEFDNYVLRQRNNWPNGFPDIGVVGAYVIKNCPERYHIVDVDTKDVNGVADSGAPVNAAKLKQFLSFDGITEKTRQELERLCSS